MLYNYDGYLIVIPSLAIIFLFDYLSRVDFIRRFTTDNSKINMDTIK